MKHFTKFLFLAVALILGTALLIACSPEEDEPAGIQIEAGFTAANRPGTGIVEFVNTTEVSPESAAGLVQYTWDFGDTDFPETNSSTETSPVHTYLKTGTYAVTLTVSIDGSDETASHTESVTVIEVAPDVTAPVIALEGEDSIVWEVGVEFIDPGFSAIDDIDGDLTNRVTKTYTRGVGTEVTGINVYNSVVYTITYSVADETGNVGSATRKVSIQGDPNNILNNAEVPSRNANWTFDPTSVSRGTVMGWPNTTSDADENNSMEVIEINDEFGLNGVLKVTSLSSADREATRTSSTYPGWWGGLAYRAATDVTKELSWTPNVVYNFSFDMWTEADGASDVYIGFEWMPEFALRQGGEKVVSPTSAKQRFTVEVTAPPVTEEDIAAKGSSGPWAGPSFIFHHLGDNAATYYVDNISLVVKE